MKKEPGHQVNGGSEELSIELLEKKRRELMEEHQRNLLQVEEELQMLRQQQEKRQQQHVEEWIECFVKMEERVEKLEESVSNVVDKEPPAPPTAAPLSEGGVAPVLNPTTPTPPNHALPAKSAQSVHEAAEQGDVRSLLRLLAAGEEVDARDASGNTALHVAAEHGHVAAVEVLVEGGAVVAARGAQNRSALHLAAAEGHVRVVRRLIKLGAVLGRPDVQGDTPLTLAAARGHAAAVEALLPLSVEPKELERCLLNAGHADVVWVLLDDARLSVGQDLGQRALIQAAGKGRLGALKALAQAGFKSCEALRLAVEGGHAACLEVLLHAGIDPKVKYSSGTTALHLAAEKGHEECVRLLLDAGADVQATDAKGRAAFISAIFSGATQCVRRLIDAGADVKACTYSDDTRRVLISPLTLASDKGHQDIVHMLLEQAAPKVMADNVS